MKEKRREDRERRRAYFKQGRWRLDSESLRPMEKGKIRSQGKAAFRPKPRETKSANRGEEAIPPFSCRRASKRGLAVAAGSGKRPRLQISIKKKKVPLNRGREEEKGRGGGKREIQYFRAILAEQGVMSFLNRHATAWGKREPNLMSWVKWRTKSRIPNALNWG